MFSSVLKKYMLRLKLKRLDKEGAQIGRNTLLFMDKESFGSEPYLVHIGDSCVISSGVMFITHDGAIRVTRQKEEYKHIDNKYGKIEVKDNVYIGENSIIMPNVTIGPNSCILPGSVVYKDVAPLCVAAGNPAVIQKTAENFQEYYHTELYPFYKKHYFKYFKNLI